MISKLRVLAVYLLALSILLSACSTGGGSPSVSSQASGESSVASAASAQETQNSPIEKIKIKFWTTWVVEQGRTDHIANFKSEFEAANPDIEIEVSAIAWADLRSTITPALKSGEGPDVFQYTPGPGYVGVMAQAGMLMELDEAATQFGWDTYLPDWYRSQHEIDGKHIRPQTCPRSIP